jgi:excinuclease ABC subunit B
VNIYDVRTKEIFQTDDPMARQYAVEKAVGDAQKASGRSTAGRAGQRGGNVKRRGR